MQQTCGTPGQTNGADRQPPIEAPRAFSAVAYSGPAVFGMMAREQARAKPGEARTAPRATRKPPHLADGASGRWQR